MKNGLKLKKSEKLAYFHTHLSPHNYNTLLPDIPTKGDEVSNNESMVYDCCLQQ